MRRPGPPGWGLGAGLTIQPCIKVTVKKPHKGDAMARIGLQSHVMMNLLQTKCQIRRRNLSLHNNKKAENDMQIAEQVLYDTNGLQSKFRYKREHKMKAHIKGYRKDRNSYIYI
jgi:hypothetical protein